jgi:hypothetical protein
MKFDLKYELIRAGIACVLGLIGYGAVMLYQLLTNTTL